MEHLQNLLQQLVAFPTVSRTSNLELLDWLSAQVEALGGRVRAVKSTHTDRANIIATLGPDAPGGLLLSGHTDVVPPGENWDSDPWVLTRMGDCFVARGAADMKGFFAAVLHAISDFDVDQLLAPVHLLASYDEEIGCQGVRDVLPFLAADPMVRPEIIIIGEPTMMRPRHSHLGKELHRLTVTTPEAHSSRAAISPSAIAVAAELICALSQVQASAPMGPDADVPPYSINCGTVHGGTAPNVIAGVCIVDFEVRHDVDNDPAEVLAPFFSALDHVDARLRVVGGTAVCELLSRYPALTTDVLASAFTRAVQIADAGKSTALGYGTEGGLLASVLDAPIMICGPGDIADAHRPNDSVSEHQLERCVHFVRELVQEFCLGNKAQSKF